MTEIYFCKKLGKDVRLTIHTKAYPKNTRGTPRAETAGTVIDDCTGASECGIQPGKHCKDYIS